MKLPFIAEQRFSRMFPTLRVTQYNWVTYYLVYDGYNGNVAVYNSTDFETALTAADGVKNIAEAYKAFCGMPQTLVKDDALALHIFNMTGWEVKK